MPRSCVESVNITYQRHLDNLIMTHLLKFAAVAMLGLFLTGCFGESKADILKKAKGADTSEQLEAALGTPDEVDKLGPLEKWSYEASDGKVVFAIVAGKVTLEATEDKAKN
jgi:hypothetical protein